MTAHARYEMWERRMDERMEKMPVNYRRNGFRLFCIGVVVGVIIALAGPYALGADYAINMDYYQKIVRVVFDFEDEAVLGAVFPCPDGWTFEAYMRHPHPGNEPAMVPVLIDKGECPR